MRSASVVDSTCRSPGAGSDEAPYDRPSPRAGVRASARPSRSSERTSRPGTVGTRPQPASVAVAVGRAADMRRRLYQRAALLGPRGGHAAAAKLLDEGRTAHAQELGCFFLVAAGLRQRRV